jgi:hypothetical protein
MKRLFSNSDPETESSSRVDRCDGCRARDRVREIVESKFFLDGEHDPSSLFGQQVRGMEIDAETQHRATHSRPQHRRPSETWGPSVWRVLYSFAFMRQNNGRDSSDQLSTNHLSRWKFGKVPTSATSEQDDRRRCALCLDDFVLGVEITGLPCLYYFHSTCVTSLVSSPHGRNCPVCKTPLANPSETQRAPEVEDDPPSFGDASFEEVD